MIFCLDHMTSTYIQMYRREKALLTAFNNSCGTHVSPLTSETNY